MKKQEFKKMKRGLGTSGAILNVPTSESQGYQKEKKKRNSKKLEIFENIRKENFPNLAKEIDFQEVQEAQRVPKKLDPRRNTSGHIMITLPKIKDKERILKAAREKETVSYKGVPIRLISQNKTLQARRGWKEVFEVMKGKDLHLKLL